MISPSLPGLPSPGSAPVLTSSRPPAGLAGRLRVPADRQTGLHALALGALAVGETRIEGLADDAGTLRFVAALRALGAEIGRSGDGMWQIWGRGVGGLTEPEEILDAGDSVAAAALLAGMAASHPILAIISGGADLRRHSMHDLLAALAPSGARLHCRADGLMPLVVRGAREALPLECELPAESGWITSAVLMAGLNAPGETLVRASGAAFSPGEALLRHCGARVGVEQDGAARVIRLQGQPELAAASIQVPADPLLAAWPLVAALVTPGSRVTLEQVGLDPLCGGLLAILREMGGDVTLLDERGEGGVATGELLVLGGDLRGVDVAAARMAELARLGPLLAVAAACAQGESRLRGLGYPNGGWLAATAAMLTANGVKVHSEGDDLMVHGNPNGPAGGGLLAVGADHDVAMSALVLGLAARQPVAMEDGGVIDTVFPGFAAAMNGLGALMR